MLLLFVSPHLRGRELARSRANSQTSNLPPNPHVVTRHRSIAELRLVGIETSRTESLTEEPSPGSNDLSMSRLRVRETIYQSPRWPRSFTQCVYKRKKLLYVVLYTAAVLL